MPCRVGERSPKGSALGEEGHRIAEADGRPGSLIVASWGLGLLALRQGDLPRALSLLERSMGLLQKADLPEFCLVPLDGASLGDDVYAVWTRR